MKAFNYLIVGPRGEKDSGKPIKPDAQYEDSTNAGDWTTLKHGIVHAITEDEAKKALLVNEINPLYHDEEVLPFVRILIRPF